MLRAMLVGACAVAAVSCNAADALEAAGAKRSPAAPSEGAGGHGARGSRGAAGPRLVIPAVIDLPYTVAGQGGSAAKVAVENDGDAPITGIAWALSGDASITLASAPTALAPGAHAEILLRYAGAAAEAIAAARLTISSAQGDASVSVFAVTGDPGLGAAAWEDVIGAGGVVCGSGATVSMPAAPYPDDGAPFTDPSVRVFLPDGYRDRGAHDVVVHFHGHKTTLAATLDAHLYQEHVWASGVNALLVVPQGPVNAASGDFGKLMKPGGLSRLLTEVLVLLYREGKIESPALGELTLTAHSGGYRAVAENLDPAARSPAARQVNLFDALYGYVPTFASFAAAGGILRSNYTALGGTPANNEALAADLAQRGIPVAGSPAFPALRGAKPVIDLAATSHDGTTRLEAAYAERLRWSAPRARRGPRVELRAAVVEGGLATVRWLAPPDEDTTGFVVERSTDGETWTTAAEVGPAETDASFPAAGGARVRVRAQVTGVDPAGVLRSDAYRADVQPTVLVVDGFDRVLDGSYGGLRHDFAAWIGEAAGSVATASHRAVTEDGFDLPSWPTVIWALGDESSGDLALSPAEQEILKAYVDGGGHLIVTGSEVGFHLAQTPSGAAFLEDVFGARYVADNSGSHVIHSTGPLASGSSITFAGRSAPYACPYPDVLAEAPGGDTVLLYGNGNIAAVGIAGRGVLVGFPIELIDAVPNRKSIVQALLSFIGS